MKSHRIGMLGLSMILLMAGWIFAQNVQQSVGSNGLVDWSNQMIKATGIGSPNPNMPETAQRAGAIDAAKKAALRNLLETVKGMTLDSETTVRNFMVENDVINTRVSGIVRNFTVVDTKYMSTGDIEVTIEMPLSGALSDALLPPQMGDTIADGLRAALCERTFAVISQHVREILTVTEAEIVAAMRLIWERVKLVVEPSSAVVTVIEAGNAAPVASYAIRPP